MMTCTSAPQVFDKEFEEWVLVTDPAGQIGDKAKLRLVRPTIATASPSSTSSLSSSALPAAPATAAAAPAAAAVLPPRIPSAALAGLSMSPAPLAGRLPEPMVEARAYSLEVRCLSSRHAASAGQFRQARSSTTNPCSAVQL